MTWRTPIGDRTLEEAEASLFRLAIYEVHGLIWLETVDDEAPHSFGVPVFDQHDAPTRLALLLSVGTALLKQTDGCPPLTALGVATVEAVYGHMQKVVLQETNRPGSTHWRGHVLAVLHESADIAEELPDRDCDCPATWQRLFAMLKARVIGPEVVRPEGTAPKASPEDLDLLSREIARLCDAKGQADVWAMDEEIDWNLENWEEE